MWAAPALVAFAADAGAFFSLREDHVGVPALALRATVAQWALAGLGGSPAAP